MNAIPPRNVLEYRNGKRMAEMEQGDFTSLVAEQGKLSPIQSVHMKPGAAGAMKPVGSV